MRPRAVADLRSTPPNTAHPLPDVRTRALHSLRTKLQHGLLTLDDLQQQHGAVLLPGIIACLDQEGLPSEGDADAALELLAAIATRPVLAARLLDLGADALLLRLQRAPAYARKAQTMLQVLLYAHGQHKQALPLAASPAPTSDVGKQSPRCQLQQLQASSPPLALLAPSVARRLSGEELSRACYELPPVAAAAAAATTAASIPASETAVHMISSVSRLVPQNSMQLLEQLGLRVHCAQLASEDEQQLFDLAMQLQPGVEEGVTLLALAQLRHGVLDDMPPEAVAAQPGLVESLVELTAVCSPHLSRQALACLDALLSALAVLPPERHAGPGSLDEHALAVAPLAHATLLRCFTLLSDERMLPHALSLAQRLMGLLTPPSALLEEAEIQHLVLPFFKAYRPLLAAAADAMVNALVSSRGRRKRGTMQPVRQAPIFGAGSGMRSSWR